MSGSNKRTLADRLSEPYRARSRPAERWGIALASGVFVFLFLLIFQPFGLSAYEGNLTLLTLGFGACTLVITALLNVMVPFFFTGYFNASDWTTGKEITWNLVNLLGVALANIMYSVAIGLVPLNSKTILTFLFYTMAVGVFPIGAGILINAIRLSRKNQRISEYVTRELEKLQKQTTPEPVEGVVCLASANGKDQLFLPLPNLLYFSAADNYVEVHYIDGKDLKRHLLRNTMKQMELLTEQHTLLIRCHKSYIVNLDHIRAVSGNAQGCLLMLDCFGLVIPASRQMRQALRDRLAERP